nr:DNA polymerase kappa isoform X1 [Tanacetum cinerariifolium]
MLQVSHLTILPGTKLHHPHNKTPTTTQHLFLPHRKVVAAVTAFSLWSTDLNNLESALRARVNLKNTKDYTDILKHASRLIKAELSLSLRLIRLRMPHFSKDKSGVQFDLRLRTLLNFIKAEDNKKQIVNEEHSTYFRDGYEAHECSHIDPSSDHLSELQQNICMSTDNIEEAVEHHRSVKALRTWKRRSLDLRKEYKSMNEVPGVIRKAPQDIRCKGKHASLVPETNTIIGSSSIISEHGFPVAVSQNSTPTSYHNGTSTHVVATCKYQKKVISDLY